MKIIFSNPDKEFRAKEILDFITGVKTPVTEEENRRKEKFTRLLSAEGVDAKTPEALRLVYEKFLGGHVREEEETPKRGRPRNTEPNENEKV